MKNKIIEILDRVSKYSNEELESELIKMNRYIEKGFTDMIHITEFNIIVNEIIKRNPIKN